MKFKIYGKNNCPSCLSAKALLDSKGLEYEYLVFGKDYDLNTFTSFSKAHKSFPLITVIEKYDGVEMHEQYLGDLNKLQQMLCGG